MNVAQLREIKAVYDFIVKNLTNLKVIRWYLACVNAISELAQLDIEGD
jgi:hypothetical protein